MNTDQHVVFIDFEPPSPRFGSGPVLRHLHELKKKGYKVTIVAHELGIQSTPADAAFEIISLPSRREWWPPHCPAWESSLHLRNWLYRRLAASHLETQPPDAVISTLSPHYSHLALKLSQHFSAPLNILYHDETHLQGAFPAWIERSNKRTLLAADRIWCVSEFLMEKTASQGNEKATRLLRPVPEGVVRPPPIFRDRTPRVFYGGSLHPFQLAPLGRIASALLNVGGSLEIRTNTNTSIDNWLLVHKNITIRPAFITNREAIEYAATKWFFTECCG